MNKFLVSLVGFFLFLSFSIKAQKADITVGCIPLTVNFAAPTAPSYFWDFKDGGFGTIQNPSRIFAKPGKFEVVLKESENGKVVGTILITVLEKPVISFKMDQSIGCSPHTVLFTNTTPAIQTIKITDYQWVFGDGTGVKGIDKTSHTFSNLGKYPITFKIETESPTCNSSVNLIDAVEVIDRPKANFSSIPENPFSCDSIVKVKYSSKSTGVKPLTYSWSFGNGNTSTSANPEEQTFKTGNYYPSLLVSYTDVPSCKASSSTNVSVGKPSAEFSIDKAAICIEGQVKVSTKSAGFLNWTFENGSKTTSRNSIDSVQFTKIGTNKISLTVTSFNQKCSASSSKDVFVDKVTAEITSIPTFSCKNPASYDFKAKTEGDKLKYYWTYAGNIDSISTVDFNVKQASSTPPIKYSTNRFEPVSVQLKVVSQTSGCKATTSKMDTLWLPNALLIPNQSSGCAPLTVKMLDSSSTYKLNKIVKWHWVFGDGTSTINSSNDAVNHTYTSAGEYLAYLIVTTEKGCTDTSYTNLIEVGTDISNEVDFAIDKSSVCPGELLNFNVTKKSSKVDGYHFESERNRTFHCSGETIVNWSYNNVVGDQDVSLVVDYNGCLSKNTKKAAVNVKGAIAKIDYYALCKSSKEYNFSSKSLNATTLAWTLGDNSTSDKSSFTHNYASSGNFTVTLTAEADGCAPSKDTRIVKVRQPKAVITADTMKLCGNKKYVISSKKSIDADNCNRGYTWSFPGSTKRPVSTVLNSDTFLFEKSGEHKVHLTVIDENGCTDTTSIKVKVFNIRANPYFEVFDSKLVPIKNKFSVCNPSFVSFNDSTAGDTTLTKWHWKFDDGSFSSARKDTHTFKKALHKDSIYYKVVLTCNDALGCEKKDTIKIKYYKPITKIEITDSTLCMGDTAYISAKDFLEGDSKLNFHWSFGNGDTSNVASHKIVYKDLKNYTVKLKYKEMSTGCNDSTQAVIKFQNIPKAIIKSDRDTVKVWCAKDLSFFSDASISSSPLTYNWKVKNSALPTVTNKDYALYLPRGLFQIFHQVSTSFGCLDSLTRTVKLYNPEGTFTMDKNVICKGDEVTFTMPLKDTLNVVDWVWDMGDGVISEGSKASDAVFKHRFNYHPSQGALDIKLKLRGPDKQCPNTIFQSISIRKIIADFNRKFNIADSITRDSSVCFTDGTFNLFNKSINASTYMWDFGDGQTSSSELNPVHKYANPGKYVVSMMIKNNGLSCVDTLRKTIFLHKNPVVKAISDVVCQGKPVQLSVVSPASTSNFKWKPATGLTNDAISNPLANLQSSINYVVTETDINKCTDSTTVMAGVIEPIIFNPFDTAIVIGDTAFLPAKKLNHLYRFLWSPLEYGICTSCSNPKVAPIKDIVYNLNVTDTLGCFTNNSNFSVKVRPETFIKLPTTFTPNGDGNNDIIFAETWGVKQLVYYQIFNRWGEMVFSTTNINEGWDGKFKGEYQNSDMYVFKVKAIDWRNNEMAHEGYINLLK